MQNEEFVAAADQWMHGAREDALLEFVLGRQHDVPPQLSDGETALLAALSAKNILDVKRVQIERIVDWYGAAIAAVPYVAVSLLPHFSCYTSMLSMLLQELDVASMGTLIDRVHACGVTFARFDHEMLSIEQALMGIHACERCTTKAIAILDRIASSTEGPSYFLRLFERVEQLDCPSSSQMLALVWSATSKYWIGDWLSSRQCLQRKALQLASGQLLFELQLAGLYDPKLNDNDADLLRSVRNACTCRILLMERKYDLERQRGGKTLLLEAAERLQGCDVAVELVKAGADVSVLHMLQHIAVAILRAVLQKHPERASEFLGSDSALQKLLLPQVPFTRMDALTLARLLHRFQVSVPASIVEQARAGGSLIIPALISFQVVQPFSIHAFNLGWEIAWRPHTHLFCEKEVQVNVLRTLLLLKRIAPTLPRDLRTIILVKVAARDWLEE